ncbi:hypothetical protein PPL_06894 [Heterostelium album PN500]|uniref:Uncharacterized protein n=1 Tax=Heterostelium pallidum (strain ATCC 26659 / Pp 5 / PN500) TaxID=670386 RepID=D3BDU1_HETP5|nr:hypothetical protein PPL_06894 [Heterostelium album PN500]EFA80072.1 hypothetical protein PPL_06894 [Heterostelium album PN500]|eukprot:XP_020432192.1 hypothetical protein PPL_06894 [Heterostelium album PN500]
MSEQPSVDATPFISFTPMIPGCDIASLLKVRSSSMLPSNTTTLIIFLINGD